ncbi:MAG: glycoside hydrolase, partial [Thiohalomonadales bacterium]
GEITVGDKKKMLRFQWDPAKCAAFPMIYHKQCLPNSLTRLVFSLCELDETRVDGGKLLPLSVKIEPV